VCWRRPAVKGCIKAGLDGEGDSHSPQLKQIRISKFLNSIFQNIQGFSTIRSTPSDLPTSRVPFSKEQIEMSAPLRSIEGQDEAGILREIHSALQGLRFGSVEITVHNGQVVQIERKEKFRLQQPSKQS